MITYLILGAYLAYIVLRGMWPRAGWFEYWLVAGFVQVAISVDTVVETDTPPILSVIFATVFFALAWYKRPRGKGKKAAKLIGEKAKATRDALVMSMPKASPIPNLVKI